MSTNQQNCLAEFEHKIKACLEQLGIPEDYGVQHNLPLQQECEQPVSIGTDIFEREQQMTVAAGDAWQEMQAAAALTGVQLQVVSAYRSVDYQAGIIQRKLDTGQCIEDILKVSAAPGYSEHHSGCALDISTPGFEPLEDAFENSPAFNWLMNHARRYHFRLSYPRDNPHGVAYEPWHWCFKASEAVSNGQGISVHARGFHPAKR